MELVVDGDGGDSGDGGGENGARRRRIHTVRGALRVLAVQFSLLNHQVSARLKVKDVDLECLDLVNRHGPVSPTVLARMAGQHPATMTGVLDRLQKGGWVAREADPDDRRAVRVRALRERSGEVYGLYAGMNTALDRICEEYSDAELELIAGFLTKVGEAGDAETNALAGG